MPKRYLLVIIITLSIHSAQAQSTNLAQYNENRLKVTKIGMLTLGGWALVNMAVSGALMGSNNGSRYYFHQMNVFWNIVNLSLAGFGYYNAVSADPFSLTLAESIQEQVSIEKLLLFNTGLDVAYVVGGFYMMERGRREVPQAERWKGYGQSLLLQGGFLLAFDIMLYTIVHQPSHALPSLLSVIQKTPNGIGFVWTL